MLLLWAILVSVCLQLYYSIHANYDLYKQNCIQQDICTSSDTAFVIWKKYTRINFEQKQLDSARAREYEREQRRLYPERYQSSSDSSYDSDSSWSSSDSDFG